MTRDSVGSSSKPAPRRPAPRLPAPSRRAASPAPLPLLIAACVSLAGAARADVLRLDNGDVMHGAVVGADETSLTFRHDGAGEVKVPWANVVHVETDAPVSLRLLDGALVKSRLARGDAPGTAKFQTDGSTEPTQIGFDRIASVNEVDEAIWSGRIALGATIQDGNTDAKAMFAGFDLERKSKKHRLEARGIYNYGENDGEVSSRNAFARAQYSFYFWDPLYAYAGAAVERDRFRDLDLRLRGGAGLGYELWGGPDRILRFEAGVEYVHEELSGDPPPGSTQADIAAFLRDSEDRDFVALHAAIHLELQITAWLRLAQRFDYLPNTRNFKDFVTRSSTIATVSVWGGIGFAGVVIWLHDEVPAPGQGRDDAMYILTLTYTF